MTDAADRKPGRAARVAGIALALGVFGALGHVAAEGWSAGEEASVAAPPVAYWQAKLPPLEPEVVAEDPPATLAAMAPAAGPPPEAAPPDAATPEPAVPGLSPAPDVATPREFEDASPVVEPEPPAAAPSPQLAALTPGPGFERPGPPAPEPRLGGPHIGDGPTATWRLNAVPFKDERGLRLVAIIIDDAGVDRARTARALRLPGPLTISFLPYATEVRRQAEEARSRGHELMVHLPMEPVSASENPGPDALTTRLPRDELLRRLALHLKRFDGYVGANNHMGSRMTADANAMLPILEELREQGLLFVDSRTSKETVAAAIAGHLGVAGAARDVFIDHEASRESVQARLEDIERIARRVGHAVAIGHPHDRTIDALERWLPGLAERGLTLAPISAVVLRRQGGR